MVRVYLWGIAVLFTLANGSMMFNMASVKNLGKITVAMKEIMYSGRSMAMEN